MEKLVSVIVTTYGRDISILNDAVTSVLNQTYNNIELIIIDDNGQGSQLQKVICNYIKTLGEKVRYIPNELNVGVQVSRNIGILASRGEYLAFLDDDDVWFPKKIENQINVIVQCNEIGMVFCDGFYMKDVFHVSNQRDHNSDAFVKNIDYEALLLNDYIGTTSQALIRKRCLAKTGMFDVNLPARQDYDMWLRISKYFKIVGINEPLYYYRVHEGEQISKNTEKVLKAFVILRKKYSSDLKHNREALSRITLKIGKRKILNGNYISGVFEIVKSFFQSPTYIYNRIIKKEKF